MRLRTMPPSRGSQIPEHCRDRNRRVNNNFPFLLCFQSYEASRQTRKDIHLKLLTLQRRAASTSRTHVFHFRSLLLSLDGVKIR